MAEIKPTMTLHINMLREAPTDDEAIAARIIQAKGWDDDVHADVLKRVRDALQRAQKDGHVVQDFGPDGCLWRIAESNRGNVS